MSKTTSERSPSSSPALLSDVLAAAPAGMLTTMSAPLGTDVPVLGSVLLDVTETLTSQTPGAVLLLVGLLPDDVVAHEVVRSAGRRKVTAVVVKRRGRSLVDLVAIAAEAGVAVLQVVDEAGWTAVDAVITSAVGAVGLGVGSSRASAADDLHAAANAVAAVFAGSVAIEDLDRRVIAYSSLPGQRIDALREAGILQRLVPMQPEDGRLYSTIFTSPGAVRFPQQGDDLARSAVAVRAGDVPLGSIWAIEGTDEITDVQLHVLEESARIVSVHLLRLRYADGIGQLARGDALVSLLDNNLPSESVMARIGIAPGPARLLLVSAVDPAARSQLPVVSAAAGRYLTAFSPSAVVASLPGWTCVLLPDHGDAAAHQAARGISVEATRAIGTPVRVACSSAAIFPTDIEAMFTEVTEVVGVADSIQYPEAVVHLADVVDHLLLQTVDAVIAGRPRLGSPAVELLLAHDAEHGSSLAPTLLTWIEEQGDPRRTGERMSMHSNSVRYRIRRALEIIGGAPEDPDARLAMWIHLRRRLRPADFTRR